ncbi:MAG: hypothetical protein EOP48_29910, partial [Sphingobacteriales bacterium]
MNSTTHDKYDAGSYTCFTSKMNFDRDLGILSGMLSGIQADQLINAAEIQALANWLEEKKKLKGEPYRSIIRCLEIVLEDGIITVEEREDILWVCNQYLENSGKFDRYTIGIQQLLGILQGISFDHSINNREIEFLDNWLEENRYLKNIYPFDEIYSLLTRSMRNGVINEDQRNELLKFCLSFQTDATGNTSLIDQISQGFCQIEPDIVIPQSIFCLTGISKKYKRREIAEKIELYGGIVRSSV